jgi:hypothetical protein
MYQYNTLVSDNIATKLSWFYTFSMVKHKDAESEMYDMHKIVSCLLETDRWFSPGTPVTSINKTDCHIINEILLKVALNTITHPNP